MKKKTIPIENFIWKIDKGSSCRKDCWCRRIVTVPKEGKRQREFIPAGQITKKDAELIVKIHNEWLTYLCTS